MTCHRLLLIRHAESANNALPEFQRIPDPGLTPRGHLQAMSVARRLASTQIDLLYCSGFLRSLQTAQYIHATRIATNSSPVPNPPTRVAIQADLFEQGGCYAGYLPDQRTPQPGMGRAELSLRFPNWEIDPRISEQGWWAHQTYESDSEATLRAQRVAQWLASHPLHRDASIALVIHADFKNLLLRALLPDSFQSHLSLGNTAISDLTWEANRWHLRYANCTQHLNID